VPRYILAILSQFTDYHNCVSVRRDQQRAAFAVSPEAVRILEGGGGRDIQIFQVKAWDRTVKLTNIDTSTLRPEVEVRDFESRLQSKRIS
jgi:hypothetical protein